MKIFKLIIVICLIYIGKFYYSYANTLDISCAFVNNNVFNYNIINVQYIININNKTAYIKEGDFPKVKGNLVYGDEGFNIIYTDERGSLVVSTFTNDGHGIYIKNIISRSGKTINTTTYEAKCDFNEGTFL